MSKPLFYPQKLPKFLGDVNLLFAQGNLAGNRRPQRRERQATREKVLQTFKNFQAELQEEPIGDVSMG